MNLFEIKYTSKKTQHKEKSFTETTSIEDIVETTTHGFAVDHPLLHELFQLIKTAIKKK